MLLYLLRASGNASMMHPVACTQAALTAPMHAHPNTSHYHAPAGPRSQGLQHTSQPACAAQQGAAGRPTVQAGGMGVHSPGSPRNPQPTSVTRTTRTAMRLSSQISMTRAMNLLLGVVGVGALHTQRGVLRQSLQRRRPHGRAHQVCVCMCDCACVCVCLHAYACPAA